tara:strand:- start:6080 stop:6754 length:675 start_codon:yes stop_codon:yes gene_type:complete
MKIYIDGCSWTWGAELEKPRKQRFSRILCDKLGAEEYNYSRCIASNNRIARNILVNHNIADYDFAIVQMTYPARTEFWNQEDDKFQDVNEMNPGPIVNADWWKDYYRLIYEEEFGDTYELMFATAIRSHCKANNVPLILATRRRIGKEEVVISDPYYSVAFADTAKKFGWKFGSHCNSMKESDFDFLMQDDKYPTFTNRSHLNEEGHIRVAEDLERMILNRIDT